MINSLFFIYFFNYFIAFLYYINYYSSMIRFVIDLTDKNETAEEIKNIVEKYYNDIGGLANLSMGDYYAFVKKIKYRMDMSPVEVVSRPKHILKHKSLGMDCKKKSILIASYLKKNGIPYRFICTSNKPTKRIHHIFVQGNFAGDWKNIDATYNRYKLFEKKKVTKAEYL